MADDDFKSTLLTKLPDIFDIGLMVIGVIVVLLAASGGFSLTGFRLPISDSPWRIGLAVFGVVVMLIGLMIRLRATNSGAPVPKIKDYGLKIAYPKAGTKLVKADVGGSYTKLPPPGYRLWVFRLYQDGGFFPLRECRINENDKTWDAQNCDIGGTTGDIRLFGVYLVGPDGKALISYIKDAHDRFKPIRDELVAKTGNNAIRYMPPASESTRDILQCDSVRVERA